MNDSLLVLTDFSDNVVTITLNRPAVLNVLDHPTALALQQALGLVNQVIDADNADAEAQRWAREKAAFVRCAATPEFAARVPAFATRANARPNRTDSEIVT